MSDGHPGATARPVRQFGLASGTTRYRCTLTGMTGTHEHVLAVVDGNTWRADWAPLEG
jgi:hypothetical protein